MKPRDPASLRRLVHYVVIAAMLWSVAVLVAVAFWSGGAFSGLASIGAPLALATLVAFIANHALRFIRWHLMLRAERQHVPWPRSLSIFLAGLGLLPTPAKAGVAARSVLLLAEGVPVHVSLAAYFAERLLDLVGLVVLATILLASALHGNAWWLAAATAVIGVIGVAVAPRVFRVIEGRFARWPRVARALEWTASCFADAGDMNRGWRLPAFVLLGMAANVIAGLMLHVALRETATPVPWATCLGILAVSHLSGSISMLPGGIGGFDVAMLAQLAAAGVSPVDALMALALVRIVTLWGSVAVGLPLLWIGTHRAAAPANTTS